MTDLESNAEFDVEMLRQYQIQRDSLLSIFKALNDQCNMGEIYFNDFVRKFDRLVDMARYLVIKDEYIELLKKEVNKQTVQNNKKEEVNLNELD